MWCPRRLGKVFQQLITCWPSTHILRNLGEQQYAGMLPFFWCKSAKKSILSSLNSWHHWIWRSNKHVLMSLTTYIYIEISNSNIHIHYIYIYIYINKGDLTRKDIKLTYSWSTSHPESWAYWAEYGQHHSCAGLVCVLENKYLQVLLMDKILHHQGWWLSHYL